MPIDRVTIQQPAIPKYRLPFFKLLAKQKNIKLKLFYSVNDKTLPNVQPKGLDATYFEMKKFKIFGSHTMLWHQAQWTGASSLVSDVLILSWDLHYLSLLPSMLRARFNGVPVILWGHGFSKNENKIKAYIRRIVGSLSTSVIFYDYNTADTYAKSGFKSEKIFVAPNSLDQLQVIEAKKYWEINDTDLSNFQLANSINKSKTIVYIGRIFPQNNLKILIEALKILVKKDESIKLIIIGNGINLAELKSFSVKMEVEKYIIWVGELYNEIEIAKWMLSSRLFCYPENIGLSIMHAFGYGLPVITSDLIIKHNPEIYSLKDKENGLLYAHGSIDSLVETVSRIMDDDEELGNMSGVALKTVNEKFNIEEMVKGFVDSINFVRFKL